MKVNQRAMRLLIFTAIVVTVGLLTSASFAQSDPPGDTNGSISSADKHFVTDAAEGGLAEVELGQLAQSKASSQIVKDFGQKMVNDHGKANNELKDCAQRLGISVPDHMSALQMAQKAKLSAYSGDHFDRAYIADMVKDHREDVAAFKREAANGQNPQIKEFASKTLPTLEEHLRLAERAEQAVTASNRSSTGSTQ
jgi:putative membrane protein